MGRPAAMGLLLSPIQVLALLLLSIPQALGSKAELDVPLWSPVSSLLFYLLLLVLLAVHVTVCTSAESSCYFCSLPWLVAGGAMMLVSALLCAVLSALAKASVGAQRLREVRRAPAEASPRPSGLGAALAHTRHSARGREERSSALRARTEALGAYPLHTRSSVLPAHRPRLFCGKTGSL